jgi:sugar porter (SP) family MFS transporter
VLVLVVVILAGALFGYDQGVISGALAGIKQQFGLSAFVTEMVTSWVTLGALAGSLAGGDLADRLGRRRTILIAGTLFVAGALVESLAPDVVALVCGRLVVGFGVGIAAVAAPLYAAEIAPALQRGRFVSAYQLAITLGIFVSYFVDAALAEQQAWRMMLGVSAAPAALLVLAILLATESPRWLLKVGRTEAARDALRRLRPDVDPGPRIQAIEASLQAPDARTSWRDVFDPRWRRPLVVGLGLAVFQQITGINAIIYYSDEIFAAAGFATTAQQTAATTWAIGGVNVIATFIAIGFIDRLGRRPLLLAGLIGMGVSLLVVGFAFRSIGTASAGAQPTAAGIVTLVALVVFIISFAFSLGPVVWTVINEIFPGRVRGRAVAVATAVNWAAAFVVSQFFLTIVTGIGAAASFWLFALFCAVGYFWVRKHVPETKGRSLEQIEASWGPAPGGTA